MNIAIRAARAAGSIIVRYLDRIDSIGVSEKGRNDFVTEVDKEAEYAIIDAIRRVYPSHGILGEETGHHSGDEYQWVIDPLDGTTNYLHGFPQFSVSIALRHKQRLEQGVVFDPLRQELFTASRGKGARLDDRRIRVTTRRSLDGALLGTGFPFRELADLEHYLDTLRALIPRTAGVRRAGSAALNLAYVAAGRLDGFWEFGLAKWDMAAGVLLIQESGGMVSGPGGEPDFMSTGDIVAGNPKVWKDMLKALAGTTAGRAGNKKSSI